LTKGKNRILIWSLFPLLIPLIAMVISDEVQWSAFDFFIMGGLLISFTLIGNYIYTSFKDQKRTWLLYILVLVFLLVWAELAVGIFNSPIAGS